MRLIAADQVIEKITNDVNDIKEESTNDVSFKIVKKATELFIKELNETPTAYDIDKVVEELEQYRKRYESIALSINDDVERRIYVAKESVMYNAIEIVKAGGKV